MNREKEEKEKASSLKPSISKNLQQAVLEQLNEEIVSKDEASEELIPLGEKKRKAKEKSPFSDHRSRVKQQFLNGGLRGWSEHRVLELLLFYAIPQKDVVGLARNLIAEFGSFRGVLDAPYDALLGVKGVREHSACFLKLLPEATAYYMGNQAETTITINQSKRAFQILAPYFVGLRNEAMYVLCLDAECKFLGVRQVAEGGMLSATVDYRRIVETILSLTSTHVYIAHNHVTKTLEPSRADWELTSSLLNLLETIDVYLLDHLIISDKNMTSLRQRSITEYKRIPWPGM